MKKCATDAIYGYRRTGSDLFKGGEGRGISPAHLIRSMVVRLLAARFLAVVQMRNRERREVELTWPEAATR